MLADIRAELEELQRRERELQVHRATAARGREQVRQHARAFLGSPAGLLTSAAAGVLAQRLVTRSGDADAGDASDERESAAGDSDLRASLVPLLRKLAIRFALAQIESLMASAAEEAEGAEGAEGAEADPAADEPADAPLP